MCLLYTVLAGLQTECVWGKAKHFKSFLGVRALQREHLLILFGFLGVRALQREHLLILFFF